MQIEHKCEPCKKIFFCHSNLKRHTTKSPMVEICICLSNPFSDNKWLNSPNMHFIWYTWCSRGYSTNTSVTEYFINWLGDPCPENLQNIITFKCLELGTWHFETMFTNHCVSCVADMSHMTPLLLTLLKCWKGVWLPGYNFHWVGPLDWFSPYSLYCPHHYSKADIKNAIFLHDQNLGWNCLPQTVRDFWYH